MQNRFTLYGHWLSGPTYKVGLMLSLCGEPFAYTHVNLLEGAHRKPEYLAKNRYGQVPCLEADGVSLCQSSSILQFLAEKLGKFDGKTPVERARVREWLFWSMDRLAPAVYRSRAARAGIAKLEPAVLTLYQEEATRALKTLDRELAKTPWLAVLEPTIADIDVYGVIHFLHDAGFDPTPYPNLAAWIERIKALPGFVAPQDALPKETRAA